MTLLPRSLYGRLLALSVLATVLALGIAGIGIGRVLEGFVVQSLDRRLDDKVFALDSTVTRDGTLDRARIALFDRVFTTDEDWRVDTPRGHAATMAGGGITFGAGARLPPPGTDGYDRPRHAPPGPRRHLGPPGERGAGASGARLGSVPFDLRLADGRWVHGRWRRVATARGPAFVAVAVPRALIDRPIRAALLPLTASLLMLGVALALATLVQLRVGLRPLRAMRDSLAAVRAGRAARIAEDQPAELAPLASEINALLDANEAALANARGHVANLAHGLKTPLATLGLALRDKDDDGALGRQLDRIDQAIRHHLGRARTATPGGAARVATALAPAVHGLADALGRIHAERAVTVAIVVDGAFAVAVDAQDLDELIGNLLDNAWRFATARIAVDAQRDGALVRLTIADDGPGIPPAARAAAMMAGQRLDEAGDGHGFGLSIARELAELYGGTLTLATAATGGLAAIVTLPHAGGGDA